MCVCEGVREAAVDMQNAEEGELMDDGREGDASETWGGRAD